MGAENLAPTGIRFPDRPARSKSLYLLSYPGPLYGWQSIDVLLRDRDMSFYLPRILSSDLDFLCEQVLLILLLSLLLVSRSRCIFPIVLYILALPEGFHRRVACTLFYSFEYYLQSLLYFVLISLCFRLQFQL